MPLTQIVELRALSLTSSGVTDTGSGVKLQDVYRELLVTLDVTGAATDANDHLDVYIDASADGGTKWYNIGHFTRVLGNGGVIRHVMALGFDHTNASSMVNAGSDADAGATQHLGFCDRIRYRGWVTDTGGNGEFTYSVAGFLK